MSGTVEILKKYNQNHILELPTSKKQLELLENIDLEKLLSGSKKLSTSSVDTSRFTFDSIDVLPVEAIQKIECNKDRYYNHGISQLRNQKLAIVILSGGQSSRLGYNHAKGMYDVGITRSISIFELLMDSLMRLVKETGIPVPLYIMTSADNHEEIQQFFASHNYFGYSSQYIEFFMQNEYPALDSEGKIYLTPDNEMLMLPSGNGDWYEVLVKSGILDKPQYSEVEWFNVVSVDNPLQNMADPVFFGAILSSGCDVGAKVIKKVSPEEKVGVICKVEGKPQIIEYYELPSALMHEKSESGEYKYQYGVTLNYIFRKSALDAHRNLEMPFHYVNKSVRVNSDTNIVLIKAERLILDMLSHYDTVCAYEIIREKEFAPIKNRSGNDSVETARTLLAKNGITL